MAPTPNTKPKNHPISLLSILATTLAALAALATAEDDVRCLQGVKSSFNDSQNKLSSWNFSNTTIGFICKFAGVSCWNERENRVVDLSLIGMNLQGTVPSALQNCESLTTLDLSDNALSGPIPPQICTWLPFLVTLDLSKNDFAGPIPPELVDCKFPNILRLNNNHLSGTIPNQLSRLAHLNIFSVATNDLSGSIALFLSDFDSSSFEGNSGLCGHPSGSNCGGLKKVYLIIIIAAGVFGAADSLVLGFGFWWWFSVRYGRR
eukprot:TRINITY_DN4674_c0_g1_i3.p1 TRINITY_DN4674_c0_g1~~TRINITY_DN4674_c0_g1_i3.p1  ORF type:complete len:262 (-),score=18.51 TRINITY_DN4674_c0_g1_i3:259-1044(-)